MSNHRNIEWTFQRRANALNYDKWIGEADGFKFVAFSHSRRVQVWDGDKMLLGLNSPKPTIAATKDWVTYELDITAELRKVLERSRKSALADAKRLERACLAVKEAEHTLAQYS